MSAGRWTLPRADLGAFPTPLQRAPRLSDELGVRVLVKREDQAGLMLGGNKVRKLACTCARPEAAAADVLLTVGGVQSNHARETAAAAARLGKDAVVVVSGEAPSDENGNLRLLRLLGARVRFAGAVGDDELAEVVADELAALRRAGREPFDVPVGAATWMGVTAWADALDETLAQCDALGVRPDHVVVAAGTGGTAAGLALGLAGRGLEIPVWGFSVNWTAARLAALAAQLVPEAAQRAGALPLAPRALELLRWDERERGPAYTVPTRACRQALWQLARTEGLLADLTYTAKAAAGLGRLVDERTVLPGQTVLYVHTGASPETFARPASELLSPDASPMQTT